MKRFKFNKMLIVAIILMNIWFTCKVFNVVAVSGVEPSALVVAWFAFTTGELWAMASIKKKKIDTESKGDYPQYEEEVDP